MISRAFVEESGNRRMEPEMRDVYEELLQRNIQVELFVQKRLMRRQLPLSKDTLVVGYVETVLAALHQLGIEPPPTNDYPDSLTPLFHRRIWKSTVGELADWLYDSKGPIFAKPEGQKKRFTGHVFSNPDDLYYAEGASRKTAIFCSEVVRWLSEYRVYVWNGEIVGVKHYAGDPALKIDELAVVEAVRLLKESGQGTSGYAVDLGVLADGKTALVEWNDGFALGSYNLDRAVYTDLLVARWCEIMGQ